MNDLIDRQVAIDNAHRQIWYRMNQQGMKDRIDEWLKSLPSAQPGWRYRHADPALDEWPKDAQAILLTIKTRDPEDFWVVTGAHFDDGWVIDYEDNYGEFDIIAWRPMPEPWRGENNDRGHKKSN